MKNEKKTDNAIAELFNGSQAPAEPEKKPEVKTVAKATKKAPAKTKPVKKAVAKPEPQEPKTPEILFINASKKRTQERTNRFNFAITPELQDCLRDYASLKGMSASDICNGILTQYFNRADVVRLITRYREFRKNQ